MNNPAKLLLLGFGLAVLVGASLVIGGPADREDAFSWDVISKGDIQEIITASGEIRAKAQINVGTCVAGVIQTIHVEDGQEVHLGDKLVTIDQVRLKEQVAQARAGLQAALKESKRLESVKLRLLDRLNRFESLWSGGLVSEEDFQQQKQDFQSAELAFQASSATVVQAEANLKALLDDLGKATLRAPINGKVTSLKAERGEMAIPGISNLPGAVLMVISDMSEMHAEVLVNESEVVRIKPGQSAQVTLEALPNAVLQGVVTEVETGAEGTGQEARLYRVKVRVAAQNEDRPALRPGMTAKVAILTQAAKASLRVPLPAVVEHECPSEAFGSRSVFVPRMVNYVYVFQGGRVQERLVEIGIADSRFFEIKGGLREGEIVLTGPLHRLKALTNLTRVDLRRLKDSVLTETEGKPR